MRGHVEELGVTIERAIEVFIVGIDLAQGLFERVHKAVGHHLVIRLRALAGELPKEHAPIHIGGHQGSSLLPRFLGSLTLFNFVMIHFETRH